MDRQDILADHPVEKGRGFMPAVSVNPGRLLFTAGLTGRNADGSIIAGGMATQTRRTFERLQGVLITLAPVLPIVSSSWCTSLISTPTTQ